jgi:hypothetical protein
MKLFLATFRLEHNPYMGRTRVDKEVSMRLIWAASDDEAEKKLYAALEKPARPGDDSTYVKDLDINEAIS